MRIERADITDAEEVLALIKGAFAPVGAQYGDPSLPPLAETLDSHRARYADHVVLKVMREGRTIGSVQGVMSGDTCHVERLVVDPDHQGRGIGRALALEIEGYFPQARRFELFTGDRSEETLGLYASIGYRECRTQRVNDGLTLVYLEKVV